MAKLSIIARDNKKEALVKRYAEKRKALKAAGDYAALDKLPRSSSQVRLRSRCKLTGSHGRKAGNDDDSYRHDG